MHSIQYFSLWCVIVSSCYPFIFDDPPVFRLEREFILLLLPIGAFGLIAQVYVLSIQVVDTPALPADAPGSLPDS